MRRLWERGNASIFTDAGLTYKDENGGSFVVIEGYDKDEELLISDQVAWDGLEVRPTRLSSKFIKCSRLFQRAICCRPARILDG